MTSKLVVNTIEADTGISSVSFASSISLSSTSVFHFGDAGVDIGADTNISRAGNGILAFNINSSEKVRITSGGLVGIGTNNPQKKLEVFDATQGVIRIRGGAGGSNSSRKADLSLFASGAREYVVRADASDAAFKIVDVTGSNTERLRIKSNGQIVLGSDGTNSELTFTQDGTSGTQLNATTTGSGGYNTLSINSATFIHKYGGNERLRIDSSGKVMIGTSTPSSNSAAYMLTVADPSNGNGNCGITIRSGNTGGTINQGSIFYSDGTSGAAEYAGYLQYSHSTSPEWLRIGVGANPRFYVYSNGNAEITDGDLKLASGHGIDFSATSNSSGANISELLDDYEEGSWTPTWHLTTANYGPNYTHQMGAYTKIGRQVTVYFSLYSTSLNGSSGSLQIAGLPFTDNTSPVEYPATAGAFPIFGFNGWTGEYISLQVVSGKIQLYGVQKNNTSYDAITHTHINGGGALFLKGQVTYNV